MHFTAPLVAALAAFSATAEAKRYICDRQHYATVAHNILNPAYFCKFYLLEERLNSPLKQFNHKQMTNLCHCFVQNSPLVRGPRKSVPIPHANYNVCNPSHIKALKAQYKHPVDFSRFWQKNKNRNHSPIPSIPNCKAVHKAASCVIAQYEASQGNGGGQTTPSSAPTTPATSPSSSPAPATSATSAAPVTTGTSAIATSVVPVTTSTIAAPAATSSAGSTSTTTSRADLLCSVGLNGILPLGCPQPTTTTTTVAPTTTPAVLVATTTTTSSSSTSSSSTA